LGLFDFWMIFGYSFYIDMISINTEKLKEKKDESLELEVIGLAINSGKIQKREVYDLQLGVVESYDGEGTVEFKGDRYKVVGYPLVTSEGKVVKKGWVQVYKMREWQE